MKFRCSSCLLRMNSVHFHTNSDLNDAHLNSICDICRQAGLNALDYVNDPVELFAEKMELNFNGKPVVTQDIQTKSNQKDAELKHDGQLNLKLENLLTNYDTNALIERQISRDKLNSVVWQILTGKLKPDLTGDYKADFGTIGLDVEYDLNELDYISREMIRREFKSRCQYCGRKGNSVDHKNPVSLSDDNSLENLTLACQECNGIKGNMPYDFFVRLNDQITAVNQKLVEYENLLLDLQAEFSQRHNKLIALNHLKNVIDDPELHHLRKQNKELQAAIDSVNSDYLELRNSRKKYFSAQWKMQQAITRNSFI